jgi:hypothetical protein
MRIVKKSLGGDPIFAAGFTWNQESAGRADSLWKMLSEQDPSC